MSANSEFIDFTETVTVPAGTITGIYEHEIVLNRDYSRCIGIKLYPNANFTQRIGFYNVSGEIFQLTHPDDWRTTTAIPPADRWKACDFDAKVKLKLKYSPLAVVPTTEVFDIVFRLRL